MNRFVLRAVRALSGPVSAPVLNAWSNPATWGGPPPAANTPISISPGTTLTLDTLTNSVGKIDVSGTLLISDRVDSSLLADRITINAGGRYVSGSLNSPNRRQHTITLLEHAASDAYRGMAYGGSDNNTALGNIPSDVRGMIVMPGGSVEIYSWVPRVTKTFIEGNHAAGSRIIKLADDVSDSWFPGYEIAFLPTGFARPDRRTEIFTVESVSGIYVTLASAAGLGYDRFGIMQYLTNTGVQTTPGTYTVSNWVQQGNEWVNLGGKKADASMHDTLDQRCRVVLLTRRTRMLSPEDEEKTTLEHGHQFMTMNEPGDGGKTYLLGVESKRGGQAGRLGAYPWHCHANSIGKPNPTTGALSSVNLGALADGQVEFHACVTNQSFNRGFTFHACQNVKNYDFTSVRTKGHSIFFESGAEYNNLLLNADVAGAEPATPGRGIIATDYVNTYQGESGGPSALWVTNLNNRIVGGRFCDAFNGAWVTLSQNATDQVNVSHGPATMPASSVGGCLGIAKLQAVYPAWSPPLQWLNNTFHSNRVFGKQFQANVIDEAGNTNSDGRVLAFNLQCAQDDGHGRSVIDGTPLQAVSPLFDGDQVWKNNNAGYHNSAYSPRYTRQLFADNGAGQATFQACGLPIYVSGFRGSLYPNGTELTLAEAASFANDFKSEITSGYQRFGVGNDFAGTIGLLGIADRVTLIDKSQNLSDAPTEANRRRIGFDSYHFTLQFQHITAFGYEATSPPMYVPERDALRTHAVCGSWDLYLQVMEHSTRNMPNWNHIGNGPMVYMTPGPNVSGQLPYTDWMPAGRGGERPANSSIGDLGSPRFGQLGGSFLDWFGTIFKQGSRRFGGQDIPFLTYDDPNVLPLLAADGGTLGMATTSTLRIGLEWLNYYNILNDSNGAPLGETPWLFQRCVVSDFSDYLVPDAKGRLAQIRQKGRAELGNPPNFGSQGGGGTMIAVPHGSVVRMYNPVTPTLVGQIKYGINPTGGGISITHTVGGEWFILGFAMDLTKTITAQFDNVSFGQVSSGALLSRLLKYCSTTFQW